MKWRPSRREYNIQIEMSDLSNILAIISLGDKEENITLLINALKDISSKSEKRKVTHPPIIPQNPKMIVLPRDAFIAPKDSPLEKSVGEISGKWLWHIPGHTGNMHGREDNSGDSGLYRGFERTKNPASRDCGSIHQFYYGSWRRLKAVPYKINSQSKR